MKMEWKKYSENDYMLETGSALKAEVIKFPWDKDWTVCIGVIRNTNPAPMLEPYLATSFKTFDEAKAYAERTVKKMIQTPGLVGRILYRYAFERVCSLEEFVGEDWIRLSDVCKKHVQEGRSSYFISERMRKTAKFLTGKGLYEMKKVKGRWWIRKKCRGEQV